MSLKFQCGLCDESYYGECVKQSNVRIGESIGLSTQTKKQVKPENCSVAYHLLFCNHSASYDDFSILTRENKTFLLELKESLLIMIDKSSLNRKMGTLHRHHCTYSRRPGNKIFARILFVLEVATLFLLYGLLLFCHV